ncbi:hypothetical protein Celaphus_00012298, partial [Cervus elaphus hippelaphus]
SMYLCLPTSICKGVSERPRIRRAEILLVNESNSVMTEYARVTFSTVAPMMSCLELYVFIKSIVLLLVYYKNKLLDKVLVLCQITMQ